MLDRLGEYDLLLAAITVPMVLASLASLVLTVPVTLLLGLGGVPASGLVGYALFVDPP
jgi:hypothetical protein